ncbi:MerR family transcriptional regulator [Nocardioides limicola]|uniref:MerR family transcriptional regulator n=1 Tax=Nocardioides limicola TaxID=2803368 RepID=UPI00193C21FA|nr:MerR family transcriptional regulator [Nocardioides sp. DJM-14]
MDNLTLTEVTQRVGMSVRNVRFYTSRGLVPPPVRRGRSAYYTSSHVARLELIQELQLHGFTLSAIERYLADVPPDAAPEEIALQRTMLAPWSSGLYLEMSRAELAERCGQEVTDERLEMLKTLGVVRDGDDGRLLVALAHLTVGLELLEMGYPLEAAHAAAKVFAEHGRAVAEELREIFLNEVKPWYQGVSSESMGQILDRLKPLSLAGLVAAYEDAVNARPHRDTRGTDSATTR